MVHHAVAPPPPAHHGHHHNHNGSLESGSTLSNRGGSRGDRPLTAREMMGLGAVAIIVILCSVIVSHRDRISGARLSVPAIILIALILEI